MAAAGKEMTFQHHGYAIHAPARMTFYKSENAQM
jgi:hypothetical protein